MVTRKIAPKRETHKVSRALLKELCILGLDPGQTNFGFCVTRVISVSNGRMRSKIIQHGRILSTVRVLTSPVTLAAQWTLFSDTMRSLINEFKVTHIIAERYMLRPGSGGTTSETVNIMLGALLTLGLPVKVIPASQWKNAVKAERDEKLDSFYEAVKANKITPHQVDACHISQYGASHILRLRPHQFPITPAMVIAASCGDAGDTTEVKKPRKVKRRPK